MHQLREKIGFLRRAAALISVAVAQHLDRNVATDLEGLVRPAAALEHASRLTHANAVPTALSVAVAFGDVQEVELAVDARA